MKYKDYKIWEEHREDNVHINWASVKFTEGEYQTQQDDDGNDIEVYVRTKKFKKVNLKDLGVIKTKKNTKGDQFVVYTDEDFGVISTHEELQQFLNKELDKIKGRKAIDVQKWQN